MGRLIENRPINFTVVYLRLKRKYYAQTETFSLIIFQQAFVTRSLTKVVGIRLHVFLELYVQDKILYFVLASTNVNIRFICRNSLKLCNKISQQCAIQAFLLYEKCFLQRCL